MVSQTNDYKSDPTGNEISPRPKNQHEKIPQLKFNYLRFYFANNALEKLYQEHLRSSQSSLSFCWTALVLFIAGALLVLVTWLISGRFLLFILASSGALALWATLRIIACNCTHISRLVNFVFATACMCLLSTESFFLIRSSGSKGFEADMLSPYHNYGTDKLSMRAFHQQAWGLELGVSFSVCLLFVVFFRVQYSWYFPSVAVWLAYTLSIVISYLDLPSEYVDIFVLWNVVLAILSLVAAYRQETFTRLIWLSSYTLYLETLQSPPTASDAYDTDHASKNKSLKSAGNPILRFFIRLFSPLGFCFNPFSLPVTQSTAVLSDMAWLHSSPKQCEEGLEHMHLRTPTLAVARAAHGNKQHFLSMLQALENVLHTPSANLTVDEEKRLLRITEALYYRNYHKSPPWYNKLPCCRRTPATVHPVELERPHRFSRNINESQRVFSEKDGGVLDPTVRASVVDDLDEVTKKWVSAELQGKRAKFTKGKNLTTLSAMNTSIRSHATLSGSNNNLHAFTASLSKRPASSRGGNIPLTPRGSSRGPSRTPSRTPSEQNMQTDEPMVPKPAVSPALSPTGTVNNGIASPATTTAPKGAAGGTAYYLNPNALGMDPTRFRKAQENASENKWLSSVARVRAHQGGNGDTGHLHKPRGNSEEDENGNHDSETEQLMQDIVVEDTLEGAQDFGADISNRLQVITDWDFNVFEFDVNTNGRPLAYIAYELFDRFRLFDLSSPIYLAEDLFLPFIDVIEREYSMDPENPNPYHTNVHAADVAQAIASMMLTPRLAALLDHTDALSLLLGAIIHDFRHPGVNNTYLIKTNDPLAIRYNDESVLENFHVSEAFGVLLQPEYNILSTLSDEAYRSVRSVMIKLVLATDLSHGARYTNGLRDRLLVPNLGSEDADKLLIMQMMIKCADVSHPTRPLDVHEEWSNRVTEEFYRQGDIERSKGLPISPLCDRTQHNLAKSQIGFIEFVVKPAFSVLTDYTNYHAWMQGLMKNLEHWKEMAKSDNPPPHQIPKTHVRALPPSDPKETPVKESKRGETVIQVSPSDAEGSKPGGGKDRSERGPSTTREGKELEDGHESKERESKEDV